MTTTPLSSILVGTDGSATAGTAVGEAIVLACALGAGLVIVSAYEPAARERKEAHPLAPSEDDDWAVGPRAAALAVLDQAARDASDAGVSEVLTFARQGDPADAILDVAEEQGCGLIVVGNQGMKGARRFLLGSVPNRVSHHAPCSVLIVRTS